MERRRVGPLPHEPRQPQRLRGVVLAQLSVIALTDSDSSRVRGVDLGDRDLRKLLRNPKMRSCLLLHGMTEHQMAKVADAVTRQVRDRSELDRKAAPVLGPAFGYAKHDDHGVALAVLEEREALPADAPTGSGVGGDGRGDGCGGGAVAGAPWVARAASC